MLPPLTAQKMRRLLETLDLLDLSELAGTSCGNAVQFDRLSKNDCIRVILAYHSSAAEVFARRKVKREYLIKFLWSCDVPVSLSLSKTEAVIRLLECWQLAEPDQQQVPAQTNYQPHLEQQQQQMRALDPGQQLQQQQQQQLQQQQQQLLQQQQQQQLQQMPDNARQSPDVASDERDFLRRLSDAFARWFFAAYHSAPGVPAEAFEAACDFSVELGGPAMPGGVHRESHRDSDRASLGLSELARVHGFAMQPNLGTGLRAERSSFGLVRVVCDCALLHRAGCVGLARLHCLLAPRLAPTAAGAEQQQQQQQQLEHSYAIRGLRLLLYLESGGVPACLMAPPQQQQQRRLPIL